ncbi:hypothetical protein Tco_1053997, partial [Tanacetum coccineum]
MDQDSANMVAASKVPCSTLEEYEIYKKDSKESLKAAIWKLHCSKLKDWNIHAVVWRNKADLDTMSMDDLYNNLKVYEPEVIGMSSSSSSTQNMAFVSSSNNNTGSTNEAVNTAHGVSTASTQVNVVNSTNIDNMSDDVISLVSCDGLGGYDWSDQANEGPNYALVAFSSSNSDSEVSNDSICLKSCLETIELLKSQNDQLLKDLKKFELMVLAYKTGLKYVEEKLEVYKANESIYSQDIKGLKFEIRIGEITIRKLRKKLDIMVDNYKKGLGYENYNAVPPPYTGNFMPPTPDLSFTGLDEFVNELVVENCKAMSSEEDRKVVKKNDDDPCIEEWVSDDEDGDVSQ